MQRLDTKILNGLNAKFAKFDARAIGLGIKKSESIIEAANTLCKNSGFGTLDTFRATIFDKRKKHNPVNRENVLSCNMIKLDDTIDVGYAYGQRVRNVQEKDIRPILRMAYAFDFVASGGITIVTMKNDPQQRKYIVDGQGRALAALLAGETEIPGTITRVDAPDDLYEKFDLINTTVKIDSWQKFINKVMTDDKHNAIETLIHDIMSEMDINMNPNIIHPKVTNNFLQGYDKLVQETKKYFGADVKGRSGDERSRGKQYKNRTFYILRMALMIHQKAFPQDHIKMGVLSGIMAYLYYVDFRVFGCNNIFTLVGKGRFDIDSNEVKYIVNNVAGIFRAAQDTNIQKYIDDMSILPSTKNKKLKKGQYLCTVKNSTWFYSAKQFGEINALHGNRVSIFGASAMARLTCILKDAYSNAYEEEVTTVISDKGTDKEVYVYDLIEQYIDGNMMLGFSDNLADDFDQAVKDTDEKTWRIACHKTR